MLLFAIGEAPVNSIGVGLSESRIAQLTLDRTSRRIQKRGWWFNTEVMTLYPNSVGELALPANALSVDSEGRRFVMRHQTIYDRQNNTYKFDQPLKVTIVLALEWDALPETARSYITIVASQQFQESTVGSPQLNGSLERQAAIALMEMNEEEAEAGNFNLFDNVELTADAYLYRRR